MKFIVGTASYLTFLLLLVLASQVGKEDEYKKRNDPGPEPSVIEWILLPWIISLILSEVGSVSNKYI